MRSNSPYSANAPDQAFSTSDLRDRTRAIRRAGTEHVLLATDVELDRCLGTPIVEGARNFLRLLLPT
jgi:hypothetical protein